jgi:hypothetical protein
MELDMDLDGCQRVGFPGWGSISSRSADTGIGGFN